MSIEIPEEGAVTLKERGADHIYSAARWECSYPANMECELADDLELDRSGEPHRVGLARAYARQRSMQMTIFHKLSRRMG